MLLLTELLILGGWLFSLRAACISYCWCCSSIIEEEKSYGSDRRLLASLVVVADQQRGGRWQEIRFLGKKEIRQFLGVLVF